MPKKAVRITVTADGKQVLQSVGSRGFSAVAYEPDGLEGLGAEEGYTRFKHMYNTSVPQ
jgi:hypothetical protein